jgi:hypothetical protein
MKGDGVILFYAAQNNHVVDTLERQLAGYKVVRCRAFNTMERRLRKPSHGLKIVLAVVENFKDLGGVEEMQGLMHDLRLILVLPDRDAKMVSQAHKMTPRFIAYADHGPEQVGAVMKKMTRGCRDKLVMPVLALADRYRGRGDMNR